MGLFTKAVDIQPRNNLFVSVWGQAKTRKTSSYIGNEEYGDPSFPLPIFVLDGDQSLVELLPKASKKTRENLYRVELVTKDLYPSRTDILKLIDRYHLAAEEAVKELDKAGGGTFVLDTATYYWQLLQWAYIGLPEPDVKKASQFAYGPLNAEFRNMVTSVKAHNVDIVLVHHAREVFVGKEGTGTYEPRDNSEVAGLVDTQVHMWYRDKPTPAGNEREYGSTVQFCRTNSMLAGLQLPSINYTMLYETIYGEPSTKNIG